VSTPAPISFKLKPVDKMEQMFSRFRSNYFLDHLIPLTDDIKNRIKEEINVTDDFIVTKELIQKVYDSYDNIFFKGYLKEALKRHNITLSFEITSGLRVIGKCSIKRIL